MQIVAGDYDHVIGVDTHARSHSLAVLERTRALVMDATDSSDPAGLERLIAQVRGCARPRRL